MIVVSNTWPIISLAAIGQLNLLQQIYSNIVIPQAVYNEIANVGTIDVASAAVQTLEWIETRQAAAVICPSPTKAAALSW
ncbi:MAG: hypothetical protein GDA48_14770 [Hormoscilla sp. GM102CHS1]|nr:hypothetical protein [Hormoscilla sp. GM102CHS1]